MEIACRQDWRYVRCHNAMTVIAPHSPVLLQNQAAVAKVDDRWRDASRRGQRLAFTMLAVFHMGEFGKVHFLFHG